MLLRGDETQAKKFPFSLVASAEDHIKFAPRGITWIMLQLQTTQLQISSRYLSRKRSHGKSDRIQGLAQPYCSAAEFYVSLPPSYLEQHDHIPLAEHCPHVLSL